MSYFDNFKANIPATLIASKAGLSYLSAASAMQLAGRPAAEFAEFDDGMPYLRCGTGALVAVDLDLPGREWSQRMWLPVMDRDNNAMTFADISVCDINNSRQRCLVKALAGAYGTGMSVFLGLAGDGEKAVKLLGVTPETDLAEVEPIVATLKEGGAPYIEWMVALAAACITDPTFGWDVLLTDDGKPYREVCDGAMVDVLTVYKDKPQILSLPIMDSQFNPIPLDKITSSDWNKTVMRALTKCIAFNTGYGLNVYADDFGTDAEVTTTAARPARKGKAADAKATEPKVTEAKPTPSAKEPTPAPVAEAPAVSKEPVTAEVAPPVAEPAPAPAAPAAEAASTPVPAPAASETPAPQAETPEYLVRFKNVLTKRGEKSGMPGLVQLFTDLDASVKYAPAEKPACFAMLVNAAALTVGAADIDALVEAIGAFSAMEDVAADTHDLVAGKLVACSLANACSKGDEALKAAAIALVEAGIAANMTDVIRLAVLGKVPAETIELVKVVVEGVPA